MKLSLFQGASCDPGPNEIGSNTANSMTPLCFPIAAGMFLQSKEANEPGYTPGFCEARGGEPVGPVELLEPATFCCQE